MRTDEQVPTRAKTGPVSSSTTCKIIQPSDTSAWQEAMANIDEESRFLCHEWTHLLAETYGYRSKLIVAYTGNRLDGALPFTVVKSPFTGTRAISLPFFDICRAYAPDPSIVTQLYETFKAEGKRENWDYLELRGDIRKLPIEKPSLSFYNHVVDLSGGPDTIFAQMASSTRRAIRKAEKSDVKIEFSNMLDAVRGFYHLQAITRKRHGLPPQPFKFFRNLHKRFLERGKGTVVTAYCNGEVAASGVYLTQGSIVHYKYGASDFRFQEARCNNLVMWNAMRHFSQQGFAHMDLGRNSLENEGLRRYKLAWGSKEKTTYYHRFDLKKDQIMLMSDDVYGWHNKIFANLPISIARLAGNLLYPHIA